MAEEKKKPSLASLVDKTDDEDEAPPSSEAGDGDFDVAAEELWDAFKADDLDAFKSALRAVKSC